MRNGLIALVVLVLGACGDGDAQPTPEEACNDAADAIASMCERCGGGTFEACRTAIGWDCTKAVRVRDEDALYQQCFPSLSSVSCDVVNAPGWSPDSSCQSQILFP